MTFQHHKAGFAVLMTQNKTYPYKYLTLKQTKKWIPSEGDLWVHLNLSEQTAINWIMADKKIAPWIKEILINTTQSRPRIIIYKQALLLVIRTTNLTPLAEPDDLVFLRLLITQNRLISIQLNSALSTNIMQEFFTQKISPCNIQSLVEYILENSLDTITNTILSLTEQVDELEERIISMSHIDTIFNDLSVILRQLVILHRFLVPQRDAFDVLTRKELPCFNMSFNNTASDIFHRMQRIVEDITLLQERIRINQDIINQYAAKKSQQNMYMLSVVATIFLPLSFLTGIFGMNVGGIPFSEEPYGLSITVGIIALFGIFLAALFKRIGWL